MVGSKPLTSGKKGSRAQATGSHVIWKGKPLTSGKKGSRAQATGSHVIWKGKPWTSLKNRSWAQGQVKPRRKRGRKVQSPSWAAGVTLESNKRHGDVVKNSFNGRHVFNNELMRVPFDEFLLTIWVFLLVPFKYECSYSLLLII